MNTEDTTNGVGLLAVFNLLELSCFNTPSTLPPVFHLLLNLLHIFMASSTGKMYLQP